MNNIYKLVWNASPGCWSVASELPRKGKPDSGTGCLILATGLLVFSGKLMANCQTVTPLPDKQVITCSGNVTGPYAIKSSNIIDKYLNINIPEGSSINYTGIPKKTGPGVVGSIFEIYSNMLIYNNGLIKWDKAEPDVAGFYSKNRNSAVQIYTASTILDTISNFINGKNGVVEIQSDNNQLTKNRHLGAVDVRSASINGKATVSNNGEISITSQASNKKTLHGINLYADNNELVNSGTINVTATNGMATIGIRAEPENPLRTVNTLSIHNQGIIAAKANESDAWGIHAENQSTGIVTDVNSSIEASSDKSNAFGIYYSALTSNRTNKGKGSITLDNKGDITVRAELQKGVAVYSRIADGNSTINNSGSMNVTASADYSAGIAVFSGADT